jgi:hypothetical protein
VDFCIARQQFAAGGEGHGLIQSQTAISRTDDTADHGAAICARDLGEKRLVFASLLLPRDGEIHRKTCRKHFRKDDERTGRGGSALQKFAHALEVRAFVFPKDVELNSEDVHGADVMLAGHAHQCTHARVLVRLEKSRFDAIPHVVSNSQTRSSARDGVRVWGGCRHNAYGWRGRTGTR